MLSFAHRVPVVRHNPQSAVEHQQRDDVMENDRYTALFEDVVALDGLVGVVMLNNSYSFVQYNATDRHKASAGLRVCAVTQINAFVCELRAQGVRAESALCYAAAARKTVLCLRILLDRCAELSLEPLWLISGRVRLNPAAGFLLITIDDPSLESHVFVNERLEKHRGPVEPVAQQPVADATPSTRRVESESKPRRLNQISHPKYKHKRYKLYNMRRKQLYRSAACFKNDGLPPRDNATTDSAQTAVTDESRDDVDGLSAVTAEDRHRVSSPEIAIDDSADANKPGCLVM